MFPCVDGKKSVLTECKALRLCFFSNGLGSGLCVNRRNIVIFTEDDMSCLSPLCRSTGNCCICGYPTDRNGSALCIVHNDSTNPLFV